jgi:hypothetical protein
MVVVYVTAWTWKLTTLTPVGIATRLLSGSPDHVGLLFVGCSAEQVVAHSDENISTLSARGSSTVFFDFINRRLTFHARVKNDFFDPIKYEQFEIFGVNADRIHALCVYMAHADPYNDPCFRCTPLCCPHSLFVCGSPQTDSMGPTHCSASVLRVIAHGAHNNRAPKDFTLNTGTDASYIPVLHEDGAVLARLRFNDDDRRVCCGLRRRLISFSPRRALRLLQKHRWLPQNGHAGLNAALESVPFISLRAH